MSSGPIVAHPPSGAGPGRPSDARRKCLNEELSVPMVSNFFSIERYYDAADKVYESFQSAFTEDKLDDAYVYGKRYCTFCLEAIPTHNYFTADRYKHLQTKHRPQVDFVLTTLAKVAGKMDEEELEKQALAWEQAQREAEEQAKRHKEEYEALQKRAYQFTSSSTPSTPTSSSNLEASALSKLDMLRKTMSQEQVVVGGTKRIQQTKQQRKTPKDGIVKPEGHHDNQHQLTIKRDPSGEEPGIPSSRYRLLSDSEDDDDHHYHHQMNGATVLPPPILPPPSSSSSSALTSSAAAPPPPSYHQVVAAAAERHGRHNQLHQRNFLGPNQQQHHNSLGETSSSSTTTSSSTSLQPKPKRRERIPIRQLQEEYRIAYTKAMANGFIQVTGVDTYQGRQGASTNGCTVISALVAARHLTSNSMAISDSLIMDVIDRQCGPLLRQIRGKLGLSGSALIIPSDVHDHLVDNQILHQDLFEGAAGGNVMDPKHMGEFLKLLAVGEDGMGSHRKAAATFFFHEHVVSIVKIVPSGGGLAYYDLIDSLPTLNSGGRSKATRTRCEGIEALAKLMRWYTSRKFTDANCTYIDRNAWDDSMADFDPRVFQGFVWSVRNNNNDNNNYNNNNNNGSNGSKQ